MSESNVASLNADLIGEPNSAANLQTPALVLELDRFEANLAAMKHHCEEQRIGLRPHSKTHKSIEIARRQIEAGAVGICCAKLGEAEVMSRGGIGDILITSPVVAPAGIERLTALNQLTERLIVVVDHPDNATAIAAAAASAGKPQAVLLDLDPGLHRTGIEPGAAALVLAQQLVNSAAIEFLGLQMYAGNLMHVHSFAERQEKSLAVMAQLAAFRDELERHGLHCEILSGGGTGSFDIDPGAGVLNELQAGSYLFMDRQYNAIEPQKGGSQPFFTSLFVQSRVVSCNRAGLATTDAGLKAFATDDEAPVVYEGGPQDAKYFFFGDEQGGLRWRSEETVTLGDWIRAVTPHCDPTINLYDELHVIRGDRLVDIWSIDARGRGA
ncbi:MAG: DSD1 family PLP-dependent enzyme [Pseudomonadales bacterium]